jgi:exonuclease III
MPPLKISTLNLNHRVTEKPIPQAFYSTLSSLTPDIMVLTEYVHGSTRDVFINKISSFGYQCKWSKKIIGQNQILIAAKCNIALGDSSPPSHDEAATSNYLHVKCHGIHIIGLRAPCYTSSTDKNSYWDQVTHSISPYKNMPCIVLGDVNCDPWKSTKSAGARQLNGLMADGWNSSNPTPMSQWSYISHPRKKTGTRATSRIDHFLTTQSLRIESAEYMSKVGDIHIAGTDSSYTDHALLSVTVYPLGTT